MKWPFPNTNINWLFYFLQDVQLWKKMGGVLPEDGTRSYSEEKSISENQSNIDPDYNPKQQDTSHMFRYIFNEISKELEFCCIYCSYRSKYKHNVALHVRTHSGFKPYKCKECNATFAQVSNLNRHIRVHTGYKPYKCTECEYACSDKSSIQNHMRTHTGDRPYKCQLCHKAFRTSSSLSRHTLTHNS